MDEVCWLLEVQQMTLHEDLCFLRVVVIRFSNRICTIGGRLQFSSYRRTPDTVSYRN